MPSKRARAMLAISHEALSLESQSQFSPAQGHVLKPLISLSNSAGSTTQAFSKSYTVFSGRYFWYLHFIRRSKLRHASLKWWPNSLSCLVEFRYLVPEPKVLNIKFYHLAKWHRWCCYEGRPGGNPCKVYRWKSTVGGQHVSVQVIIPTPDDLIKVAGPAVLDI